MRNKNLLSKIKLSLIIIYIFYISFYVLYKYLLINIYLTKKKMNEIITIKIGNSHLSHMQFITSIT